MFLHQYNLFLSQNLTKAKKRGKTHTMKTNLDMTGAGAVPGHRQPAQGGVGPLQDGVHFLTKLRVCL